jgi:hypothetical protein
MSSTVGIRATSRSTRPEWLSARCARHTPRCEAKRGLPVPLDLLMHLQHSPVYLLSFQTTEAVASTRPVQQFSSRHMRVSSELQGYHEKQLIAMNVASLLVLRR